MNIWHDIDEERIKKDDFVAVIEIPKGCKNKYELDKKTGSLRLDRVLYTATHIQPNSQFINNFICGRTNKQLLWRTINRTVRKIQLNSIPLL